MNVRNSAGSKLPTAHLIGVLLGITHSVHAGPHEYLTKLVNGNLEFRDAILEHNTTKGQLWYSYTASKGNVLVRSSPWRKALDEQEFNLSTDDRISCKNGDLFWRFRWDSGGFIETDLQSIKEDKINGALATLVSLSGQTIAGDLLWLGIPDYWNNSKPIDSSGRTWEGKVIWRNGEQFLSKLTIAGNSITNIVELPSRTDSYKRQIKVIQFEKESAWPNSIEVFNWLDSGQLEKIYNTRLVSIERFRTRDLALFEMTNHIANGAPAIFRIRNSVETRTELKDQRQTFIRLMGYRVELSHIRAIIWVLGIGICLLLLKSSLPQRLKNETESVPL